MRLLFDENLSRKLVSRLADLFPGSSHVAMEELLRSRDIEIWDHARAHGYVIVTGDADFYELATTFGPPPKVIWLRGGNKSTHKVEQLLRDQAIRLIEFAEDQERVVLILKA